nr:hypothetical protein [Paenibacillus sp. PAMC21692]
MSIVVENDDGPQVSGMCVLAKQLQQRGVRIRNASSDNNQLRIEQMDDRSDCRPQRGNRFLHDVRRERVSGLPQGDDVPRVQRLLDADPVCRSKPLVHPPRDARAGGILLQSRPFLKRCIRK